MTKIRANVRYDERLNKHYYREFEIADKLPEIGEEIRFNPIYIVTNIEQISLDIDQGNDIVWNYSYYKVTSISHEYDDDEAVDYIAIEKS